MNCKERDPVPKYQTRTREDVHMVSAICRPTQLNIIDYAGHHGRNFQNQRNLLLISCFDHEGLIVAIQIVGTVRLDW